MASRNATLLPSGEMAASSAIMGPIGLARKWMSSQSMGSGGLRPHSQVDRKDGRDGVVAEPGAGGFSRSST